MPVEKVAARNVLKREPGRGCHRETTEDPSSVHHNRTSNHHQEMSDGCAYNVTFKTLPSQLSIAELDSLVAAVFDTMEDERFFEFVEAQVQLRTTGGPLPTFLDVTEDANWWANLASKIELSAYLVACFNRLPLGEKKAFLDAATKRVGI